MAGNKRAASPALEEFLDVAGIMNTCANAKVNSVLTRLSPMEDGKKGEFLMVNCQMGRQCYRFTGLTDWGEGNQMTSMKRGRRWQ